MKRCFCDLHLKVNPQDAQATQRVIETAAKFGYQRIGITFSGQIEDAQIANLKAACKQMGLDFVVRADLSHATKRTLCVFFANIAANWKSFV
jgi:hypothetical protein